MFNVGTQELLIILLLVFVLFGPRHIPEFARAFGKGLGDIRRAISGVEEDVRKTTGGLPRIPRTLDQLAELAGEPRPENPAGEDRPRKALRSLEEMPAQMLDPVRTSAEVQAETTGDAPATAEDPREGPAPGGTSGTAGEERSS